MRDKQYLMIPGPTPVPAKVMEGIMAPPIGHRTPEFGQIIKEVTENIKEIYQTKNDLFILTSSGTGAMEAAVANFVNSGEKAIIMDNGNFGERWVKICDRYGVDAEVISGPWGEQADPKALANRLNQDKNGEIKAIFVTHNETSTGVLNDVKALREAMGDHPALFIVDSVSGMAAAPLKVDEWKLDVVVSGSQKAYMIPPGLAFVSVSDKAWSASDKVKNPRFYFDLRAAKKSYDEKYNTPYTPATNLVLGLQCSLKMMKEEGLENIYKRHNYFKNIVRTAVRALGLELLATDKAASASVTAIKKPENIDVKDITKIMRTKHNIVMAGGQGKLKNDIFRIGHLGYVHVNDIIVTIACLEMTLKELGMNVELGQGVRAMQEFILKGDK